MSTGTRSTMILTIITAIVATLVVVAVILALQPAPTFDPGTPEATLQGFYQAIDDGDADLAETYMTAELTARCGDHWYWYDRGVAVRVVITDSDVGDTEAEMDIRITEAYGDGPFGGGGYDHDETAAMIKQGEVWLISEPVWPMDEWACGDRNEDL